MSKWHKVTLNEMVSASIPGDWGSDPKGEGNVIVLRAADFTKDCRLRETIGVERRVLSQSLASRVLKMGDILIEKSGGSPDQPVGRAVIFDRENDKQIYSFSNFLQLLRVKEEFDNNFVHYLLSYLYSAGLVYKYQQQTTGIINFKLEDYLSEQVLVPSAISEQIKVSAILGLIEINIDKTDELIRKYEQVKAGLMHDFFTRGVTADGNLRPPRDQVPELYKETPIGWIPKEWGVASVYQLGSIKLGRQRSPDKHTGKWPTPYLRVANVFDGFIDYSDILEMDFTPSEREIFSIKYGDILLNEGQSLELVGRSSLYLGEDDQFCFQNTLVRFRCYKDQYPVFYGFLFKWWLETGLFLQIAKQTTSVAHLGADRFAKMACPIVNPNEQQMIGDKLSAVQKKIQLEQNQLSKIREIKSGLMHDLLTGRIRVRFDS